MKKPILVLHNTLNGYNIASNTIYSTSRSRYVFRHELKHAQQCQTRFRTVIIFFSYFRGYVPLLSTLSFHVIYTFYPLLGILVGSYVVTAVVAMVSLEVDATLWALKRTDDYDDAFLGLSTYFVAACEVMFCLLAAVSLWYLLLAISLTLFRYLYLYTKI